MEIRVNLTRKDLYKILEEKFGNGIFIIDYVESDKMWEKRTGDKLSQMKEPPDNKIAISLSIDNN